MKINLKDIVNEAHLSPSFHETIGRARVLDEKRSIGRAADKRVGLVGGDRLELPTLSV